MKTTQKSAKLSSVCYNIRGPVFKRARQMEEDGHETIGLNIGSLTSFGFDAPGEIRLDMTRNLPNSAGYSDSKGVSTTRKTVIHYAQEQGIKNVTPDDVHLGSGASELISLATNVLLDAGDGLLLPTPDYPLWTAMTSLSGSTPIHYACDEADGRTPDLDDIRARITPNTKGIVVINPNNPTGALYSDELLLGIVAIARKHGLVISADEVYDRVLFDDSKHVTIGSLSEDVLMVTFNGLLKSCHSCDHRAGWTVASGDKRPARGYIEGLNMSSSIRLYANMPDQWAIQIVLGGCQSIKDLVAPGDRIRRQHDLAHELITAIPGVTCVELKAAPYMFPCLNPAACPIEDNQTLIRQLLEERRVLLIQSIGFSWHLPDHLRVVFLLHEGDFREVIGRIARSLRRYHQHYGTGIRAAWHRFSTRSVVAGWTEVSALCVFVFRFFVFLWHIS